ncbi:hypothetical protein L1049_022548 [Liquidambar formosana]|uniref:BHLH domain-containing protein n=1 Tax=Liquidambar formosana TaxID=63359 RepID=A0AAP0RCP5_LIQFO
MAEECTDSSLATSSSAPNWWDHPSSLSSWNNTSPWHLQNPSSNSSCDEDVSISSTSFTNASNHSSLTVESSRQLVEPASSNDLIGEPPASHNHLWSQVLLSVGSNGELQNSQDVGENLLGGLSSKSLSTAGMFDPACDYLKKIDSSWELISNSTSFTNFDKQFNGLSDNLIESERLTRLSNLVSNWSIAPPDPEVDRQFERQPCNNISLSSSSDQYLPLDLCHMKQTFGDSACGMGTNRNSGLYSSYGHDLKVENEYREIEVPGSALFRRSFDSTNRNGYHQLGLNSSMVGDNSNNYYYGMHDAPCANERKLTDVLSFKGRLGKPLVDLHASKPSLKSSNLSDCKKQGLPSTSLARNNGRGQGVTSEGKKKRSEDTSDTVLKKPKHESSTGSPVKMQAPKVKLADRITALQQIVSPFGKTDTASVLLEAIGYIRFLQQQVQLLSNPYMKTNPSKDPWGGFERKDKGDVKLDLKSRGLCLVPISCTPQVYREVNTGSDYWTPTYRGCLYR